MATWRGSAEWGPEQVPPIHGPAYAPQLTMADYRRMALELREYRRFKMPNQTEEKKLDTLTRQHVSRAAMIDHGAFFGAAHRGQAWT